MDERGQASVEWVGVVALVATVLAAAVLLALPGNGVAGTFVRQFQRALCIVSSGVCDLDQRPCVVTSAATHDEAHLSLALLRVGRDEVILRERQSDGSVLVTYLGDTSFGLDGGLGADAWVKAAGVDLAAGRSARAALLAMVGGGETWRFPDPYAADAGMTALADGRTPTRGERVEVVDRRGTRVELTGRTSRDKVAGTLGLDAGLIQASVRDPRDGSSTHVLSRGGGGEALLRRTKDVGQAGGDLEERIAVRAAADGRPLELTIVRSGRLEGAVSLPEQVQEIATELLGGDHGGRRWIVEQRLDLTDAVNLQAARAYINAISHPAAMLGQTTYALRERLEQAGVTEARTYAVSSSDRGGFGGHVAAGIKVGGGVSERLDEMQLLDARVRAADGTWRTRTECLQVA